LGTKPAGAYAAFYGIGLYGSSYYDTTWWDDSLVPQAPEVRKGEYIPTGPTVRKVESSTPNRPIIRAVGIGYITTPKLRKVKYGMPDDAYT